MIPAEAIAAAPGVELEPVRCAICGSDAAHEVCWGRDRLCGQPGEFRIVECGGCSLTYLNPRPTARALEAFYPNEYPPHRPAAGNPAVPNRTRMWVKAWAARWYTRGLQFDPVHVRETLRRIEDFPPYFPLGFFPTKPGGRLLDVGCGSGIYLHAFQKLGWEAYGVEISPGVAERARKTFGLNVITSELEEARFPDGYFDVVTLIHVMEHLRHPVRTLQEVRRILTADGIAVVALPNLRSLARLLFRAHWFHWDVPRHLYHYSPTSLRRLLAKVGGIRLVRVNHVPVANGFTGSWAYLCQEHPHLGKACPGWVISRLVPPLAWAAALAGLSDSIVVYVRKVAECP
jgi:2-polyprenyl-3-methyl-5-hydroxy-6-metoxy-1,4-benzoquinol methylase